jgi:hypothetical protein
MRIVGIVLVFLTFCSPALGQPHDPQALEGCWRNVEDDRRPGHLFSLCFGAEDVTVFFWTPSGGLDYSAVEWALGPKSTIQIADETCRYRLERQTLYLSECSYPGAFRKF